MKQIAKNCRAVDPRIRTAAACSMTNTGDKFLTGEDREQWIKLVDISTDHYVPPRTSYGPMLAKYWGKENTDTESWIAANELLLPQVMCQFLACGQDRVTPWHPAMTYYPVPGSPMKHHMPHPVALATNVFNVFCTGRPFQRLLFLDHLPWAFQFGTGNDAVVGLLPRVLHSNFQVRNGDPNGLPYRIAVDDRFLYLVYISHHGYGKIGSHWVQRFDRRTGKPERFSKGLEQNGLIQVYPPPEEDDWDQPITDVVVTESLILLGDRRADRVLKYDKATGAELGQFPVRGPGPMAVDGAGRLWVVQDDSRVAVFDLDGQRLAEPLSNLGKIVGLCFGPGHKLYLPDDDSRQLLIYRIDGLEAVRERTFGQQARPGDDAPDRFYQLIDVAVAPGGSPVTVERMPVGGTRLSRWAGDLKRPLWTHLGLEFTGYAAYSTDDPDTVLSSYFQRYRVDKQTGRWAFRGNLFTGGYIGNAWWHGPPRWVKLGDNRFFYFANGDGIQAYGLAGDQLRFVMALGGREPDVHGKIPPGAPLGQWTWTDADADATVDDREVNWFKQPGEDRYAVFGMNVDSPGNVVYCDHHTRAIRLVPLAGLNDAGSPQYDWSQARELVPADATDVKLFPLMAVRNERDEIYAFGRSELFPQHPGSGPAWMGGWALAKFDAHGNRLWATRLVQHCTGMDYVPGDGVVVVGYFEKAVVYHYNRDGILVGLAAPGAPAAGVSGWLDNTASIACSRDPRDGKIDVFAEEDYAHRILWYRFDDSQIRVRRQIIEKK